jgi:hypothetical protein
VIQALKGHGFSRAIQPVHTGHILYRADRGDGLQVFRERGHLEGKDALERERSCGEA